MTQVLETKRKYTKEQLEDIDFMLAESLKAVKEGRIRRVQPSDDSYLKDTKARHAAILEDIKAGRVKRVH